MKNYINCTRIITLLNMEGGHVGETKSSDTRGEGRPLPCLRLTPRGVGDVAARDGAERSSDVTVRHPASHAFKGDVWANFRDTGMKTESEDQTRRGKKESLALTARNR